VAAVIFSLVATKFAVTSAFGLVPVGVVNTHGLVFAPLLQVKLVPLQLLNAKPEFAVAVNVTLVPPGILLEVQVLGQLMPPVLLTTLPSPVGDIVTTMT